MKVGINRSEVKQSTGGGVRIELKCMRFVSWNEMHESHEKQSNAAEITTKKTNGLHITTGYIQESRLLKFVNKQ